MQTTSTTMLFRCAFVVTICVTTYLSLLDMSELPPISIWDKLLHASIFLFLSYLLHRSFPEVKTWSPNHISQMLLLILYGVLIEWLQGQTPYRDASFLDIAADIVGISGYWLFCSYWRTGANASQRG